MKKNEQYLNVLIQLDKYVTVREWAIEIAKQYPSSETDDENEKNRIAKIINYLHTQLSTGKWSNMISIEDKSATPKKVKYISDTNLSNENTTNPSSSIKAVKKVNFELLMEELNHLFGNVALPKRKNYNIFENFGNAIGYKEFVAFEMAKRNQNVIEISNKLDYIEEIVKAFQNLDNRFKDWLLSIKDWESMFDNNPPEFDVNSETKEHYVFIANLPLQNFKEKINSLNKKQEDTIAKPENLVYLKIMADHLQEKLVKEYYIYKDGYFFFKQNGYFDPDEVIVSDAFTKDDYNTYHLEDKIKLSIDKFMSQKADNMRRTADIFFMYDYYKARKDDGYENFSTLDLKLELTKYHGIKIKRGNMASTFSYEKCRQRYEDFIGLEADFYDVEKTISEKIKLMDKFINDGLYKYIIFY